MTTTEKALETIAKPAKYLRSDPARGLREAKPELLRVDPAGGDQGEGIIRGASIVTRGEALGHGEWIDEQFLADVTDHINATEAGVKARFTHPSLSGDGLGSFLGRTKNASKVDDQVFADIHFSRSGHNTPDGDLASYVMDLADDAPNEFGVSIVFMPDVGAQDRHRADNTDERGEFHSTDELNVDDLPHVRLAELRAADVVDEPAANPAGLFQRGQEIAHEADGLLGYALGLADYSAPTMTTLDVDPDRVRDFVNRFFKSHGLEIREIETMPSETPPTDMTVETESPAKPPVESAELSTEPATPPAKTGADYMAAFGAANGSLWFAQGVSFDDAQVKHNESMAAENERLRTQLAALEAGGGGEESPVDFASDDKVDKRQGQTGLASCIKIR